MNELEQEGVQLEDARREFAAISKSLLTSYAALSERAQHVELELSRTNAELETKVDELDRVTRDLEAILAALPTGVVVRDAAGRIVRVNPAAARILGSSADVLLGSPGHALLQGPDATGEARELRRPNGQRLVVSSRWSEIAPCAGSVEILDDETQLAILSERLHTMDKVAALGTMAGGIAHEIRNPLNAVGGFAKLLTKELAPESKAHRWANLIVEGTHEANAIISSLLCFARPEKLELEIIEPEELLRQAVTAACDSGGVARTRWRIDVASTVPPYRGDRIKLRQAVRNLVANAIDVQPGGGAVSVQQHLEGDDVVIRVSDAGPGIPEHIRGRILDPFFTTRAEGTGLGLALVSTIAQLHGGRIEVNPDASALGGAELSLRFPFQPAS